MSDPRDDLMDWLRDAHGMEQQAETMLAATSSRLQHYPEFKERIDRHLEETRGQAGRLRRIIEARGGDTSVVKDMTGRMAATVQGLGASMAGDEVVKLALASYHFEHLEIASYRSLIAAAEALGDAEIAEVCGATLSEEIAMADWCADWIPVVTQRYISRSANDQAAKR
ncbi:MAG: ferritin-like domain-containing protein [Xylophilus ampelinus]